MYDHGTARRKPFVSHGSDMTYNPARTIGLVSKIYQRRRS